MNQHRSTAAPKNQSPPPCCNAAVAKATGTKWYRARGPPTPAQHGRGTHRGGAQGRTAAPTKASRSHCGAAAERRPRGRTAAQTAGGHARPGAQRRSRRAKAKGDAPRRRPRARKHTSRHERDKPQAPDAERERDTPHTPKSPRQAGVGQGDLGSVTTEPTGIVETNRAPDASPRHLDTAGKKYATK
jgi:hypothetical protein